MNKRIFVASLAALVVFASGCTTTSGGSSDPAARRKSIDTTVDAALGELYRQVPGSRDLVNRAQGVLVFPNVLEAGFMFGASRGHGALRVGGATVSYHATTSGSFGLQAGAQSTAVFVLFMTQDALDRFRSSNGWTVGADASVTLLSVGRLRADDFGHGAAAGDRLRALEPRPDGWHLDSTARASRRSTCEPAPGPPAAGQPPAAGGIACHPAWRQPSSRGPARHGRTAGGAGR
jgi:hypothetical protein